MRAVGPAETRSRRPRGRLVTFERGVHKISGGEGWADVWYKGHFAWEYKRKRRNLLEAYQQLLLYRENLDNPPLLVVSDLDRFQIHTVSRPEWAVHGGDLRSEESAGRQSRGQTRPEGCNVKRENALRLLGLCCLLESIQFQASYSSAA